MALTFTKYVADNVPLYGDVQAWAGKVTFDSSYPTGGEAIAASDFSANEILFVSVNAITDVATKHIRWDRAASKFQLFVEDAISGISAEAANASDQSAVDAEILVLVRDR